MGNDTEALERAADELVACIPSLGRADAVEVLYKLWLLLERLESGKAGRNGQR